MHSILIYGGTFDPIHMGHINTAKAVQKEFHFDEFFFMPCKIPLLKNEAKASASHRLNMLEIALDDVEKAYHFKISSCELDRDDPSYTVDSLKFFRNLYGEDCSINLLMGMDTFNQLPNWHHSDEVLTLANIVLIERAGFHRFIDKIKPLLARHEIKSADIKTRPFGSIYRFNAGSYPISSSLIKEKISLKENRLSDFLPKKVFAYINQHHLYK